MLKLSSQQIADIYFAAREKGLLDTSDTAVIFYDTTILQNRLDLLLKYFPAGTLHAIAVKTNASPGVLRYIAQQGFGLEAASMEEVLLAKEAGVPHEKIVFDSPVKTRQEIGYCHEHLPGILVNANSLQELARYPEGFSGKIGLRVNPLVSADAPGMLNVSNKASKFGVPVTREEEIIAACINYHSVSCLHLHVGSGIKKYDANIAAVELVTALARRINAQREQAGIATRIDTIDIGGGIDFDAVSGDCSMSDFVARLQNIPGLFEQFNVVTEFGKFVHQHASFAVSDVEYVMEPAEPGEPYMAFIHVGADLFVRKIYSDLPIDYPVSVIGKQGGEQVYNIAGPLCFAGDIVFHRVSLPALQEGDKLVIQDIGANTLSMWSRHCNRKEPKLILAEERNLSIG